MHRLAPAFPWFVRASWAILAFSEGPTLAAALHGWSVAPRTVASDGLWAGWAVVLSASLVRHPIGLTSLRMGTPAAVVAAVAAAVGSHVSALGIGTSVAALLLAFAPETGRVFVNGPAYPNERRFPLRVPGPLLLGPLYLAWVIAVVGPAVGALLLANRQWVAGGLVLALSVPAAIVLTRALHGLSRRWIVFVPAGMVVHDPMTLADPVLFVRQVIESFGPAAADTDSLDLTQRSPGLALELILREKVDMTLVRPGRRGGEMGASARLLVTPTRPGAVLAEARASDPSGLMHHTGRMVRRVFAAFASAALTLAALATVVTLAWVGSGAGNPVGAQVTIPGETTAPPATTAPPPPPTTEPAATTAPPAATTTTAKPKPTTTAGPTTTTTIGIAPALAPPPNATPITTTTLPLPQPGTGHISAIFPALSIGAFVLILLAGLARLVRTSPRFAR